MQGFDGLFVLKYIKDSMTNLDTMPKVLVNGTKILTLVFRNVRLLDSFSFIPMALSKFPETFDLKELKKGWMCHLFASEENLNYLGPLPHPDYYGSQFFSQSKKQVLKNGMPRDQNTCLITNKSLKIIAYLTSSFSKKGAFRLEK